MVEATTKNTAPDRDGGWRLANNLCDAVLELGYEFSSALSRLGITSVWDTEPKTWRGTIELRLNPVKKDQ